MNGGCGGRGTGDLGPARRVSLHSQPLVWNPSCLDTRKKPSRRSQVRPQGIYGPDVGGEGLPGTSCFLRAGKEEPAPLPEHSMVSRLFLCVLVNCREFA